MSGWSGAEISGFPGCPSPRGFGSKVEMSGDAGMSSGISAYNVASETTKSVGSPFSDKLRIIQVTRPT